MPLLHSRGENGVVHLLCLSGEGTATGWATSRLVWVTGKKGSVVFIVLCLREPPPHPSDLIWYHSLFSIPKVSEGFLSFFFLLKHMSLLVIILFGRLQEPFRAQGGPGRSDSNPNVKSLFQCDGLETFSRCFVAGFLVCCRLFMAQECFKRNMEAIPWR